MNNLTPVFFKNLIAMCNRLNVNPADMLLVFTLESGLDSKSMTGHTVGLNQFYKDSYRNYFNGSREQYANLPPEDQLTSIEAYFKNVIGGKSINSAAQLYCANLLPATLNFPGVIRKDRSTVLAIKEGKPGSDQTYGSSSLTYGSVYGSNSGLDVNKDDMITYGDLEDILKSKMSDSRYQWAVKELEKVSGESQSSTLSSDSSPSTPEAASEKEDGGQTVLEFLSTVVEGMKQMTSQFNPFAAFAALDQENEFLIKISSPRLEDNLEVARILCTAYEDLLDAKCRTYTDGDFVEISCKTRGEVKQCFAAIDQFSNEFLNEFEDRTEIDTVSLRVFANKKPSYGELDIKTAESNYRKFQLKILGNKNGK